MGCQLGRIVDLESPDSIRQDGDELRVGGEFNVGTYAQGVVLAQQLMGYPNQDEEVVPFRYDATIAYGVLDGFYYVESTEVDWVKLAGKMFSWSAVLVAVPGRQAPLFELKSNGVLRDNDHAVANGEPWLAVSTTHDAWAVEGEDVDDAGGPFSTEDTPLYGVLRLTGDTTPDLFYDATLTYSGSPRTFYDNACRIEVPTNDGAWATVVGRQLWDVDSASALWRISNSHVRATGYQSNVDTVMLLELWDTGSSRWVEVIAAEITDATNLARFPYALTVLHDRPESVAVRWHFSSSVVGNGGQKIEDIDITLRRGASWVEMRRVVHDTFADQLIVRPASSAASTAITAGLRRTADDAFDNRWMLLSPEAQDNVAASGQLRTDATDATEQNVMVGVEVDGSTGSATEDATYLITLYFAAMRHRQRIVTR